MTQDRITVPAVRAKCYGKPLWEEKLTSVTFGTSIGARGAAMLWICKGGVTGYESFYVEDYHDPQHQKGWTACAGKEGSWDQLYVPAESMKKVFDYFHF